jgi:hypothetical protein
MLPLPPPGPPPPVAPPPGVPDGAGAGTALDEVVVVVVVVLVGPPLSPPPQPTANRSMAVPKNSVSAVRTEFICNPLSSRAPEVPVMIGSETR